jgi:hypothetical protein
VGAARPPAGGSNPTPNNSDLKDFNRAIALQATPDQMAWFRQLTKSTEAARKAVQNLIPPAENANQPESSRYSDLSDAVEEAQSNNQRFVRSFSTSQQSELATLIKKLSKATTDVSKQSRGLAQELARSEIDRKKITSVVEKLDKALTGFQTGQLDIGNEMGIQSEEHSQ